MIRFETAIQTCHLHCFKHELIFSFDVWFNWILHSNISAAIWLFWIILMVCNLIPSNRIGHNSIRNRNGWFPFPRVSTPIRGIHLITCSDHISRPRFYWLPKTSDVTDPRVTSLSPSQGQSCHRIRRCFAILCHSHGGGVFKIAISDVIESCHFNFISFLSKKQRKNWVGPLSFWTV